MHIYSNIIPYKETFPMNKKPLENFIQATGGDRLVEKVSNLVQNNETLQKTLSQGMEYASQGLAKGIELANQGIQKGKQFIQNIQNNAQIEHAQAQYEQYLQDKYKEEQYKEEQFKKEQCKETQYKEEQFKKEQCKETQYKEEQFKKEQCKETQCSQEQQPSTPHLIEIQEKTLYQFFDELFYHTEQHEARRIENKTLAPILVIYIKGNFENRFVELQQIGQGNHTIIFQNILNHAQQQQYQSIYIQGMRYNSIMQKQLSKISSSQIQQIFFDIS